MINRTMQIKPYINNYTALYMAALFLIILNLNTAAAEDEDIHLGITEYEITCMSCHGIDGTGKGPKAIELKITPPDLTQIAKANNGIFPFREIVKIVDGRETVPAHSQREMPVWGRRYQTSDASEQSPNEIERSVRRRIDAIVRYLETIQKP